MINIKVFKSTLALTSLLSVSSAFAMHASDEDSSDGRQGTYLKQEHSATQEKRSPVPVSNKQDLRFDENKEGKPPRDQKYSNQETEPFSDKGKPPLLEGTPITPDSLSYRHIIRGVGADYDDYWQVGLHSDYFEGGV